MAPKVTDVIGAILVGTLFFLTILSISILRTKLEKKIDEGSDRLMRSRGMEFDEKGLKVKTRIDLNQEQLIQLASNRAQSIKSKIENSEGLISFGKKEFN
uniref:Uncharacterized protein n=2 Tax=Phakopsora pachyrhizi TaxID=170000 RepID=A0A0S1MIB7_PHAPC